MQLNNDKPKQITLFSETDLHGTILFANDAFCEVSKYYRDGLIGKPHNIIRHPEMPSELFKLLWSTIRKGDTFKGVIKNRTSDNSHYWVDTIIMPTRNQDGEIEKYIGVRHLIPDDKIAQELFDQQMKSLKMLNRPYHFFL
jgi:PAS domain S-box-containing protein